MLERLDVACGVAVASTNGERGMRPRGREVEKRVGSALSATPKNGKFHRKSGLVRKYGGCSSVFLTENSVADFHSFEIGRIVVSNAIAPMEVHGRQQVAASKNLDVACL